MLHRLASNAFWLGRYLERAENTARLISVVQQLSLMPEYAAAIEAPFVDGLAVGGNLAAYTEKLGPPTPGGVAAWLLIDLESPASVVTHLRAARDNGRSMRHLITDAYWDALNIAWLEAQALDQETLDRRGVDDLSTWVIGRCQLVRGASDDLLRDALPEVIAIGQFSERTDHQARLMSVFLRGAAADPEASFGPGSPAHRRWEALLGAMCLDDTYRRTHTARLDPVHALKLMLLHPTSPRSLASGARRLRQSATEIFHGDLPKALATALDELDRHLADATDGAMVTSNLGTYLLALGERTGAVASAMGEVIAG